MVRSPESDPKAHPFWYAQVLGIFHAIVTHSGPRSRNPHKQHSMHFLWVRWFGVEPGYRSGRCYARLPKVGFVPDNDPYAFGFLDPSFVIRGCHLIPAFASGKTSDLLSTDGPTAARIQGSVSDWANFYVSIFVDRDMFFRHLGGGIGHTDPIHADSAKSQEEGSDIEDNSKPRNDARYCATHAEFEQDSDDSSHNSDSDLDGPEARSDDDSTDDADGDENDIDDGENGTDDENLGYGNL
ncbi:hypothetical protein BDZ94DRAFT_1372458 [Collybia nuda]|uniref:Uncharacterized protein n=1 Tax=Collybia nuda TaxID=64659 RepID=A0A9P5Y0T3_9AGAR|nr:hypothetical protein BDZ94DRAFT_1372458 [Collybia nuda]